ncbi:hypothetical protein LLS1_33210 [Leifsonia sp. LS1]|uniref:hypothetical protein n=1 Tax=Leifsonia sp. LS1 TaxID=2828483 RepID=UPI001CFE4A94|nr:hypothetical protein [Leifsonia sp. LS1]GIT81652.1 hypothetical protein LLS1_33210 [Leifsonia sp. LS1]
MKARVAASVVLALTVAFGTAGCGLIAPQATTKHYDASDGVSGNVGTVDVRNAIIVTDASGGTVGSLVVTLVNTGSTAQRVAVTAGDKSSDPAYVTVDAGQTKKIGTDPESTSGNVFFTPFSALPGSLYPVYFQYGDQTGMQLQVPVLDGGLAEYKDLVPPTVLPTPTHTATATSTPEPTETAAP